MVWIDECQQNQGTGDGHKEGYGRGDRRAQQWIQSFDAIVRFREIQYRRRDVDYFESARWIQWNQGRAAGQREDLVCQSTEGRNCPRSIGSVEYANGQSRIPSVGLSSLGWIGFGTEIDNGGETYGRERRKNEEQRVRLR